jgi:hypothetical protein
MKNIHLDLTREEALIALRALEFSIARQYRQRHHWLGMDTPHAREWKAEDYAKLRTAISLARKLDLRADTLFCKRLDQPACKTFAGLRARRLLDRKTRASFNSPLPIAA